jgi:hypothetical protein
VGDTVGNTNDFHSHVLTILHHNVQSLSNKLFQLFILLNSDFIHADILYFTEYWLMEEQMRVLNIDHFKSVNNCSRFSSNHAGLCIFVQQDWQTNEVNYLKGRGSEKVSEINVVGMVDFKFTLACIH